MDKLSLDWPQSADELLNQAKQGCDLVKLIMAGTHHIESWLIENQILPLLQAQQLASLCFEVTANAQEKRSAIIVPLPDGSAFARNADAHWSALDKQEALLEIQHIGSRFAPGDHWIHGFTALFQSVDDALIALSPLEVAALWEKITGAKPRGFEVSALDQVEAFSLGAINKMLHVQSRLGL